MRPVTLAVVVVAAAGGQVEPLVWKDWNKAKGINQIPPSTLNSLKCAPIPTRLPTPPPKDELVDLPDYSTDEPEVDDKEEPIEAIESRLNWKSSADSELSGSLMRTGRHRRFVELQGYDFKFPVIITYEDILHFLEELTRDQVEFWKSQLPTISFNSSSPHHRTIRAASADEFYPNNELPSNSCGVIFTKSEFAACFSDGDLQWTVEHLTADTLGSRTAFTQYIPDRVADGRANEKLQSALLLKDYELGQITFASHHAKNSLAFEEAFSFPTNSQLQYGVMKRNDWARIELFLTELIRASRTQSVYVVSGPIYDSSFPSTVECFESPSTLTIGKGADELHVPTHFFKVVKRLTRDGHASSAAFVVPNRLIKDEYKIKDFEVPIETIEDYTDLDLTAMKTSLQLCTGRICDRRYSKGQCNAAARYNEWVKRKNPKTVGQIAKLLYETAKTRVAQFFRWLKCKVTFIAKFLWARIKDAIPGVSTVTSVCGYLVNKENQFTTQACEMLVTALYAAATTVAAV